MEVDVNQKSLRRVAKGPIPWSLKAGQKAQQHWDPGKDSFSLKAPKHVALRLFRPWWRTHSKAASMQRQTPRAGPWDVPRSTLGSTVLWSLRELPLLDLQPRQILWNYFWLFGGSSLSALCKPLSSSHKCAVVRFMLSLHCSGSWGPLRRAHLFFPSPSEHKIRRHERVGGSSALGCTLCHCVQCASALTSFHITACCIVYMVNGSILPSYRKSFRKSRNWPSLKQEGQAQQDQEVLVLNL